MQDLTGVRFEIAKKDILTALKAQGSSVFRLAELRAFLDSNRDFWRLPKNLGVRDFIGFLVEAGALEELTFSSKLYGKKTVYTRTQATDLEVGLAFAPGAYYSHGTAAYLHGLTEQLPRTLYLNREQSPKWVSLPELAQEAIDRAFRNQPRSSKYIFNFRDRRICVVSGKQTARLEVGEVKGPAGESVVATKIERTLIDLAVRPQYAGGVHEVLAAYEAARGRASSNVIIATLKKLDYIYPYHQAIGFYMARAGYPVSAQTRLRELGLQFKFYLVAGVKDLDYVPEWKLFVPKRL